MRLRAVERTGMEMCALMFDPDPGEDLVMKRWDGVRDLRKRLLRTRRASALMMVCNDLCRQLSGPLNASDGVPTIVKDAFVGKGGIPGHHGREFELTVCGLEALVQLVLSKQRFRRSEGWCAVDFIASCLWSGLSFLPALEGPKLEAFRKRAVEAARARAIAGSEVGRRRLTTQALARFDAASVEPADYIAAAEQTVDALTHNARLDREEIDVLRWTLRGTSELVTAPLRSLSSEARVVVSGVEIGAVMQSPPAPSHRNRILCGVDGEPRITLVQVLQGMGEARRAIADSFGQSDVIHKAPFVFPLMSALCSKENRQGRGVDIARSLSEWGTRALLETALLRRSNKGTAT